MLKIGDFSKLSRVSIRMLRYYDEKELLNPAEIDASTGYRYYREDQLPVIGRIVALRDMGFSLAAIGEMLKNGDDPERTLAFLRARRAELEALSVDTQQKLRLLDCTPVTADYACTDASGAPFSPLGDTYIEVSIRAQRMAFYQNGEQLALTDIVTGKPDGHQTPTGLYHVQNKAPDCWLTGPDYHVFVKYWVGFYGAYGIHDASWRTLFGSDYYLYGGSHGCVNTPDAAMQTIYEAIEPGVPVLVH